MPKILRHLVFATLTVVTACFVLVVIYTFPDDISAVAAITVASLLTAPLIPVGVTYWLNELVSEIRFRLWMARR